MTKHRAVIVAAAAALATAGAAAAATTTITINLQGGTGTRTFKACGNTHHYTLYRAGTRIQIDGAVHPTPSAFRVKLKVKQCVRGTFRTIWTASAHERPDGTYTGVFVAHRRGAFFARAYLHVGSHEIKSDKKHFQVH